MLQTHAQSSIPSPDSRIVGYIADPAKQNIGFYWKDQTGTPYKSIANLIKDCQAIGQKILFAMNGGMFNPDFAPMGLYITQHKSIIPVDTGSGSGNFYLKPNGVLYITSKNKACIRLTDDLASPHAPDTIQSATQSGPMLVIDGKLHPAFQQGSTNLNIRNGVGLLPNNRLLFAISKEPINFYDFAEYFRLNGCISALYLDGFVSRAYIPDSNYTQTDGNFGVIIAVTARP
jgi:uncharacterized protein YigE (DUF2233 family)